MSRVKPGLSENTIVENVPTEVWTTNGARRYGVNVVVDEGTFEEFRTGYRCLRCYAPQDEPFPDVCVEAKHPDRICTYEIRRYQLEHLGREFRGEQRYGPTVVEADDERDDWAPRSGIWLPKGV